MWSWGRNCREDELNTLVDFPSFYLFFWASETKRKKIIPSEQLPSQWGWGEVRLKRSSEEATFPWGCPVMAERGSGTPQGLPSHHHHGDSQRDGCGHWHSRTHSVHILATSMPLSERRTQGQSMASSLSCQTLLQKVPGSPSSGHWSWWRIQTPGPRTV